MAKEINVIGHKIEIGAGSSSGHPDFKGQQTSDIRNWIRIDGGEWYKIAHGFNILQVLELFEYCKRESQVLAIFEMLGDVLRVKAKPILKESVLPISDVSVSLPIEEIKNAIYQFKKEELPDAESPFHYEAEIWAGMKHFIQWLEAKRQ